MRIVLAAVVSIVLCLGLLVGLFFAEHIFRPVGTEAFSTEWALVAAGFALAPQLLAGAVVFTWLHRRGRTRATDFALGGLVVGVASVGLLFLERWEWLGADLALILIGTAVFGSLSYWVLGVRRAGPNNSFKPNPLRGSA